MRAKHRKRRNGEGSLAYDKALDRWVGRATVGGVRKRFYGPRGDDSTKAKIQVEERMQPYLALRSTDGSQDVAGAIRTFLATNTHLAPTTVALYNTAAKHIIGKLDSKYAPDPIARKKLVDLEPSDVRAFYARLQTGETMKLKVHVLLHRVLEEAVEMEVIHRNPASKVPKPKPQRKEIGVWNPDEIVAFLNAAASHRLYALFVLALTTTMGPAELFGLRRNDVHLSEGYLVVQRNLVNVEGTLHEKATKTAKRRRKIMLPPIAVSALRQRFELALREGHAASPHVFTSDEGHPIRIENFRKRVWNPLLETVAENVEKAARESGDTRYRFPRITLYGMRHTANALMGYLGVPIAVASARMGHSSAKMTLDVYGHLFASADSEAANRLESFFTGKLAVGRP